MKRCYFRCRCHCWCQMLRNGNNQEAERLLTWTPRHNICHNFPQRVFFSGQMYKYMKHGSLVWPARDFTFVKWQAHCTVYFDQLTRCHLNIEYCMPLVEHPSWKHFWRFALGLISTALERVLPGPFHFIAKKAFGLTLEASNRAMTIYFSHNLQLQHYPIFDTIVVICTLIQ